MELGLFFMPLHRPEKPWAQALEEDRQTILLADRLGYAETWMGEHFSTKAEQVPAPLMFMATLLQDTKMRFGTGVVNLGHRHPIVVAAEAAQFDQLSGGRLMLGVGPGGLASDAEVFGRPDMAERVRAAGESIDMIIQAWTAEAPFEMKGEFWNASLTDQAWPSHGVGELPRPLQQPHPPLAMAMVSASGNTVNMVAERSFIPISANFVPISFVQQHWENYEIRRNELGLDVDRSIWRVCRNILITDSDAQADEICADPDGVFSHYFRYLRGVAQMPELDQTLPIETLNEQLKVGSAVNKSVIAGTAATVTEKLVEMADQIGRFGTLVSVGHDHDETELWTNSVRALAEDVAPALAQHVDIL
ncbi:MAG: alkanesulfonate monooxygenase SsuD [Candidatus Poriferisodalaceae bacterium]|jgi:alkanesulfonate monooxygenase SsuD/methylene tetrahydromethanopterin reductase-like flavin-dependent oxidoreductase (luciferase family)